RQHLRSLVRRRVPRLRVQVEAFGEPDPGRRESGIDVDGSSELTLGLRAALSVEPKRVVPAAKKCFVGLGLDRSPARSPVSARLARAQLASEQVRGSLRDFVNIDGVDSKLALVRVRKRSDQSDPRIDTLRPALD